MIRRQPVMAREEGGLDTVCYKNDHRQSFDNAKGSERDTKANKNVVSIGKISSP